MKYILKKNKERNAEKKLFYHAKGKNIYIVKTYKDFFIVIAVETVQQQVVPSEVFGGLAPEDD